MYAPQHFAKRCWNAQLVQEANSASARICLPLPLNLIQCVLDACEKSNSIHDVITRAIWLCDQISAHGNHLSRAASHKQVLIPFSRLGTLIICDSKNQQRVREEHQHQTPREVYWGSRLLLISPPPIHGAVLHSIYINIFAGDFWSKYNKRARRERERSSRPPEKKSPSLQPHFYGRRCSWISSTAASCRHSSLSLSSSRFSSDRCWCCERASSSRKLTPRMPSCRYALFAF